MKIWYELKKCLSIKGILILTVICLLGNIGIRFLYHNEDESPATLQEERALFEQTLSEIDGSDEMDEELTEMCVERLALIDYSLEHNVPFQKLSVWSNIAKNRFLENIVVIFIAIMCFGLFSVEYENRTFPSLILFNRNDHLRVMLKKYASMLIVVPVVLLVFYLVAILFGTVAYRNGNNLALVFKQGQVVEETFTPEIISLAVSVLVRGIFYGAIGAALSVVSRGKGVGSAAVAVLVLFETALKNFFDAYKIGKFLPFKHVGVLSKITEASGSAIAKSAGCLICYCLVIMAFSFIWFRRQQRA